MKFTHRFEILARWLAVGVATVASVGVAVGQVPPKTGGAPGAPGSAPGTSGQTAAQAGKVIEIKKQLTGDFTYRFITDKDQTQPPAPVPSAASPDASVPVSVPASMPLKSTTLEVVDKTRGNVAKIPLSEGSSITLTEASFRYCQTVFVTVLHDGKPVTDVLVTLTGADKDHKLSLGWPLKPADVGVAQFPDVPMGTPITVAVNGAGHPSISQTSTIVAGHPADGYHWPAISVDWADVGVVTAPPLAPTTTAPNEIHAGGTHGAAPSTEPESGGFFSSIVDKLLGLVVIAAVIYLCIWAFNKGHVKTLLDKAGINTADMQAGGAQQPSPFDKPAKPPISPITEGTSDPFGGAGYAAAAAPVAAVGPRLVATAGSYSGTIFALAGAHSEIGRDTANAVPLPQDTNTSRRHASIEVNGSEFQIVDNGSSNGTFLNGVRIPANSPQALRIGDEIQIGMTRFRFEA